VFTRILILSGYRYKQIILASSGETDRVRKEEVLERVKEERNVLQTIKRRKTKGIGNLLRRKCLIKHVIEGKLEGRIEVTGR
jgi:hypothetical protein